MAQLFVRIAGAFGITALALFFVGLIPFIADPSVGAGIAAKPPSFSVNRQLKGDRLPSNFAPVASRSGVQNGVPQNGLQNDRGAQEQPLKPRKIPVGCEGAFSPISSPRLAHILGRCTT
jgi:hypothetical protein